jgi:hypothetical protein
MRVNFCVVFSLTTIFTRLSFAYMYTLFVVWRKQNPHQQHLKKKFIHIIWNLTTSRSCSNRWRRTRKHLNISFLHSSLSLSLTHSTHIFVFFSSTHLHSISLWVFVSESWALRWAYYILHSHSPSISFVLFFSLTFFIFFLLTKLSPSLKLYTTSLEIQDI